MFHKVHAGAIETLFDEQNQSLFKTADLGKYLGIEDIKNNFKDFPLHYTRPRSGLEGVGLTPSLRKTKNPHDIFINLDGSIEMAVRSKKPKAVALVKWLNKKGIEKIQEEHQQVIEEKDAALALLTDDLQSRDNQIQAIKYENVALQAQKDVYQAELQRCQDVITYLKTRHVPHARDPGKDNIIIIVRKQTTSVKDKYHDLPYYVARIQRRKRYVKLRWFDRHFPDHEIIVEIDNPNSIHAFNRFEEERHSEQKYNHFRLMDLTREELYAMGAPVILDDEEEE